MIWTHRFGWLLRWTLVYVFGWRFQDSRGGGRHTTVPDLPDRCVVASWPHTSYWDSFYVFYLCSCSLGWGAMRSGSFATFLVWAGVPAWQVKRNAKASQTEQIAEIIKGYEEKDKKCRLYVAVSGTTKKSETIKTGFYYIAKAAGVPIVFGSFDYRTRTIWLSDPVDPANMGPDQLLAAMAKYYKDNDLMECGKNVKNTTPLKFRDETAAQ